MKLTNYFQSRMTRNAPGEDGSQAPAETATDAAATNDAGTDAADVAATETTTTTAQEATSPDFSWAGEEYLKDGNFDNDAFRNNYQDLLTAKTLQDERAGGVPEDGKYGWDLPAELDFGEIKLPEGVEINIATDDPDFAPVFEDFGGFLHKNGIPQSEATELMGYLAKFEAAKTAKQYAAAQASYEKIGPTDAARDARIAKVQRALESKLPAEQATALKSMTSDVSALRALESLVMAATGPRSPSATPKNGNTEGMTPFERLKHANAQAET